MWEVTNCTAILRIVFQKTCVKGAVCCSLPDARPRAGEEVRIRVVCLVHFQKEMLDLEFPSWTGLVARTPRRCSHAAGELHVLPLVRRHAMCVTLGCWRSLSFLERHAAPWLGRLLLPMGSSDVTCGLCAVWCRAFAVSCGREQFHKVHYHRCSGRLFGLFFSPTVTTTTGVD